MKPTPRSKSWIPAFAGMTLLLLSGCESIGEGSTIQSITIEAANAVHETTPFQLQQCLRDQLIVVATFTDGTRADFSFRATWASSDPAVVQVSNNDIPTAVVSNGTFATISTLPYRPGTLIPQAASGTATITASYIGLTATRAVTIATPTMRIAPVSPGADPNVVQPTKFLGPDTTLTYAFFAERSTGEIETAVTLNALGVLNPVLWRLQGGVFDPNDSAVPGDFDKYAAPNATTPSVTISSNTGFVSGVENDPATYTVEALTSLCPADPAFIATAPVRVANFATQALTLAYEPDFNGVGLTETGDMVAGTSQALVATGHLDTDGDPATAEESLDLSTQVDLRIDHTTSCTAGTPNCTCDAGNVNCEKRLFGSVNSQVFTLVTDDSANAIVQACFGGEDAVHTDDCEEDDIDDNASFESGSLALQSIPIDLTGDTASFAITPTGAQEPAFTYPGTRFTAYGTFKARTGTPFAGGTSDTTMQNFTRLASWVTRPAGVTDQFSDIAVVRNTNDGFFNPIGAIAYLKDVTANTAVDVSILLRAPYDQMDLPAPVPFTVCPSTGC